MFKPRLIRPLPARLAGDGTKLYAISLAEPFSEFGTYLDRLTQVKSGMNLPWAETPCFAIFHRGQVAAYLVFGWWGNDNELFTSVSVEVDGQWVEDPRRYSFCVWDLEVFWHERNSYVRHMYSGTRDIVGYRSDLLGA
jgi:hypothetical protein